MVEDEVDAMIRRAIGGDRAAVASVLAAGPISRDARTVALAALLAERPEWISRAEAFAVTSRDRQVVAIGRAHLRAEHELVDALARDHLADHPDSLIVAWVASGAARRD